MKDFFESTKINNDDVEVLNKGFEHALFKYKEEVEKYNIYNKRARYPISVMAFLIAFATIVSEYHKFEINVVLSSSWLIVCAILIIVILIGYIYITIPHKVDHYTVPKNSDLISAFNSKKKIDYIKWLIAIYINDANEYRKLNKYRGWGLLLMNICLTLIVIIFFYVLFYQQLQNLITSLHRWVSL